MFRQFVLGTALAAFALITSLNAQQQPSPVQPSPVKRTVLQQADVPGTNLELSYATVEITGGFKTGRHYHPGVVIVSVVEGELRLGFDDQPEKVLHAGDSFTIPDRAIHTDRADKSAKLIGVYVLEKGKPLTLPAP
jgi:quercetin dioxygenase-like cupin family protein